MSHRHVEVGEVLRAIRKRPGRRIVSVIGIDRYPSLGVLKNAVSDAQGLRDLLVKHFDFEEPVPHLLDEAATKESIEELVEDHLRDELPPDDELVLFFVGHGLTRVDRIGSSEWVTGYVSPVDTRAGRWTSQIASGAWSIANVGRHGDEKYATIDANRGGPLRATGGCQGVAGPVAEDQDGVVGGANARDNRHWFTACAVVRMRSDRRSTERASVMWPLVLPQGLGIALNGRYCR